VVLSDMLELGDQSRALHEGLAEAIEAAGWIWSIRPGPR
jgi:UDP-N-acetylmuramoyl-tripeptide--D-alanyl-D-alanine ligase